MRGKSNIPKMKVRKRNGELVDMDQEKIHSRLESLRLGSSIGQAELTKVDCKLIAKKVIRGMENDMSTSDIDILSSEESAYMAPKEPEYGSMASRIYINNLHKETSESFYETAKALRNYVNPKTGKKSPILGKETFEVIEENRESIEKKINYSRDYLIDFFGARTLTRAYLLKINGKVVERPQHMWMRVSIGIHSDDLASAFKTYDLMSKLMATHASPTLFNSGTVNPQLSSCFLLAMKDDSISGIFDTVKQTAMISKYAGGIGLHASNIRAYGSYISGTNGASNGLVPFLKVFNSTARSVDQGGGKRKGAFAIYIEPWHADIHEVLKMRKNTTKDEQACRDLFLALWVPDLFMRRVQEDGQWSLMSPDECPGLEDCYGKKFEDLYEEYESQGKYRSQIRAQVLMYDIIDSWIETSSPYFLFKDRCNELSNQKNLGTIRSSNLCSEIIEYSDPNEIAVCNLASVALSKMIRDGEFDHELLYDTVYQLAKNLDRVIDVNKYPLPEGKTSNMKNRPMGIGVQGLADAFMELRLPFTSPEARKLNKEIFETMSYASLCASADLAKEFGPYESFQGSPLSQGKFHWEMFGSQVSDRWDWEELRNTIACVGVRNSLRIALMPTASSSQILGNHECFEPITSNFFSRKTKAGEYVIVNRRLIKDLQQRGLWTETIRSTILKNRGDLGSIEAIPEELRELYKTMYEISQKDIIDMAADRQAFVDQSQSMNLYFTDPGRDKLYSAIMYGWQKRLKTGLYYLRQREASYSTNLEVDKRSLDGFKFQFSDSSDSEPVEPELIGGGGPIEDYMCISCGS